MLAAGTPTGSTADRTERRTGARADGVRVAVLPSFLGSGRRPIAYVIAAVLAVVGFLTVVPSTPAHASTTELHTLLAQTRASYKVPKLTRSASLDKVAQQWTQWMATNKTLKHNPSMAKQIPAGWTVAGENVGYAGTASQVHQAWMKSTGHRNNILDRDYNAVGIGFVKVGTRVWATQVFAKYSKVPNPVGTSTSSVLGTKVSAARLADLSGDRKSDVVARDSAGRLWVYPGTGRGTLGARKSAGGGWGAYSVWSPGDLTGDGKGDVLARDRSGRLYTYPGNGRSGLQPRRYIGSGWSGYTIATPGDFTGDGRADILARDSKGRLWLYPGNGRGAFGARKQIGSGWQKFGVIVGAGDLTGDGKADVIARDRTGYLWLYRGNGKGGWAAAGQRIGGGWQAFTSISASGDLTGDGRVDVVARDKSGRLWLYPGNGRGGFTARKQIGSGWNGMGQIA
jgi:hypothetical protein